MGESGHVCDGPNGHRVIHRRFEVEKKAFGVLKLYTHFAV